MLIGPNVRSALEQLWANRLRSVLTVLGIVIAVASTITVVSVVRGFTAYVADFLQGLGTNAMWVWSERPGGEAGKRLGLTARLRNLPSQLPGGQQQRVAIARALVAQPQLLLADEPTGNLDSPSARQVMDLLERISAEERMTIVMVTHDQELAARAHRKVHILDGRLIDPAAPSS